MQVWLFLAKAGLIKTLGSLSRVELPPVQQGAVLSESMRSFLVSYTDRAIGWGVRWTGRKCFFRAFILGSILRRHGVPISFNIGLGKPLSRSRRGYTDGHCWLTLDGESFYEDTNPHLTYPHFICEGPNGIKFWSGLWLPVSDFSAPLSQTDKMTHNREADL